MSSTGNVENIVVSDAGPLIGLARAGFLELLKTLYGIIWIPPEVHHELHPKSNLPGAHQLAQAITDGWLQVHELSLESRRDLVDLALILNPGEAQAIILAEQIKCRFLLIDERRGRRIARQRGLLIVGTAGILIAARKQGLLPAVLPVMDELAATGYRFSSALRDEVARLCDEPLE